MTTDSSISIRNQAIINHAPQILIAQWLTALEVEPKSHTKTAAAMLFKTTMVMTLSTVNLQNGEVT